MIIPLRSLAPPRADSVNAQVGDRLSMFPMNAQCPNYHYLLDG
jgi:hypothetical protein